MGSAAGLAAELALAALGAVRARRVPLGAVLGAAGLAGAMLELLRDNEACRAMGAAGRRKVEEVLNWDRVNRTMADALKGIAHRER